MKTAVEAFGVLLIGAALGLAAHVVRRDDGIVLGSPTPSVGEPVVCGAGGAHGGARAPAWITPEEARPLLDDPQVVFVDARTRDEFVAGHVSGSLSVPVDDAHLDAALPQLRGARTVVAYCDAHGSCAKSAQLAQQLLASGLHDVRILQEGIEGWMSRGYPGEAGTCRLCPQ